MNRRRALVGLMIAWILTGLVAGWRLHQLGGIFGEAVPLGASITTQLVRAFPWLLAALVAWVATGWWPIGRDEILRPITLHAALGLVVVFAQAVLLAALNATLVPPGLRPLDPWANLPEDLTLRAPPSLVVYAVLVVVAVVARTEQRRSQEVPAAGRPGPDSS